MTALHALLGFTFWTVLLVASVFLYRGLRFVSGAPINNWPRGVKHTSDAPIIQRIEDAHANCLENLPLFAIIVFAAIATGRMESINHFAAYVLYARVAQSSVHMIGTGRPHVFIRASLWSIQLVLFLVMIVRLMN